MQKQSPIKSFLSGSSSVVKSFLGVGAPTIDNISPFSYRQDSLAKGSGWLFGANGGLDVHFSYSGLTDVVKAYECCAPVYSIINKQAYAFINGKTWITNKKGKEATTEFAKKVNTLLQQPNALQNAKQFEAQIAIYMRLFSYCVILPIKPVGYGNEDATALWIIPPYMCEFEFAKQTFYNLKKGFISNIKVTYGNEISNLKPENVIILRDITPAFDNIFLPGSTMKPLQQNISNLIGIYNSKGALINYRGALGILSPEIDPAGAITQDPEDKEELQRELLQYGLKQGQFKFIIANAAMKWQQMGISYKELMLPEWAEDETMIICDALNYPYRLMANSKSSSMNGTEVREYKTILYEDFVIPFADMIYEQLSQAFNCADNNCKIEKDYSHLAILQGDAVKKAQARNLRNQGLQIEFYNNLITLNRWLQLNDEDVMEGEMGNKYYYELIKEGFTFGKVGVSMADIFPQQQQQITN